MDKEAGAEVPDSSGPPAAKRRRTLGAALSEPARAAGGGFGFWSLGLPWPLTSISPLAGTSSSAAPAVLSAAPPPETALPPFAALALGRGGGGRLNPRRASGGADKAPDGADGGEEESDGEEGSEEDDEDEDEDDEDSGSFDHAARDDDGEEDEVPFEIELDHGWQPLDMPTARRILEAEARGEHKLEFNARGHRYMIDLDFMVQTNIRTGAMRHIRRREMLAEEPSASECDDGEEGVGASLRTLLLAPPPPAPAAFRGVASGEPFERLSPEDVKGTIARLVPDAATWVAPRSGGTLAIDFLVRSYDRGFPALPKAISKHLAAGVRLVVGAVREPERAGLTPSRARNLAQQLAEAFMNCQAVQARTIDALQAEVLGVASHSLAAQMRAFVEDHRELALDRTVCHFHPGAHTMSDSNPEQQLPHLANRYRRCLAGHAGFSGLRLDAARADRNASGRLPVPSSRALRKFRNEFSVRELLRAVVADVNQTDSNANRRISRDLLMAWAGSTPSVGHRIFYDESKPDQYTDFTPSEEHLAMQQPALYEALAAEMLLSALGPAAPEAASEAAGSAVVTV